MKSSGLKKDIAISDYYLVFSQVTAKPHEV